MITWSVEQVKKYLSKKQIAVQKIDLSKPTPKKANTGRSNTFKNKVTKEPAASPSSHLKRNAQSMNRGMPKEPQSFQNPYLHNTSLDSWRALLSERNEKLWDYSPTTRSMKSNRVYNATYSEVRKSKAKSPKKIFEQMDFVRWMKAVRYESSRTLKLSAKEVNQMVNEGESFWELLDQLDY